MPRTDLFPAIEPYQTGMLRVDDPHVLYWEQCGNPFGTPALFLHGGPGAGSSSTHRRFFDPDHYRVVLVDQRGSGRSTPLGCVEANSIDYLIADLERLRLSLKIERWLLFGGSWGSTLALAYAQTHPKRCLSLILRGVFLMRRSEIDWFLNGMRLFHPEAWKRFASFVPAAERHDLLEAYWRRLDHPDPAIRMAAARSWSLYEGSCSTVVPNPDLPTVAGEDVHALGLARLEAHYFRANLFQPDSLLLDRIPLIRHLPAIIVQGRHDIVCPIVTADEVCQRWPEAEYRIIPGAGHSAMEPGIRAALIAATERFKELR
ncbi:putative proline iminopeptidase [uncultured Gammaproteobacteria bacterium]